ncbi:MAG: 2-oxo acid dehydrogenase subunit E2 [Streptosporangiales bacterium]|nr:2-oxo acid dehydrogenase subunit E2 [Streptosporangiales bacterium]
MSELTDFLLPDVGEGIAEAELVEWLVGVGDPVAADQSIVVVETDKSQVELPAPVAGTVAEIGPAVGDVVAVGTLLTRIATGGDRDGSGTSEQPPRRRPLASPSVRKRALRLAIDLADVPGTGPRGRVLATDVDAYETRVGAPEPNPAPEPARKAALESESEPVPQPATEPTPPTERGDTVVQLRGVRRRVARSMTEALQIPHIHEFREVDATQLLAARETLQAGFARDGLRLTVLPLLVRACVWALGRHPSFNARFDAERERLTQYGSVALGVATATDDGLLVPVLRDAEQRSLRDTARELARLTAVARTRTASQSDLSGGTCTVTNFGSLGTWLGTPVIRPPEVAIVGFGRVTEKVVPVDGVPAVRPVLPIVAATDHRVNDGAHLAALLSDIAAVIEQPLLLLDQG